MVVNPQKALCLKFLLVTCAGIVIDEEPQPQFVQS